MGTVWGTRVLFFKDVAHTLRADGEEQKQELLSWYRSKSPYILVLIFALLFFFLAWGTEVKIEKVGWGGVLSLFCATCFVIGLRFRKKNIQHVATMSADKIKSNTIIGTVVFFSFLFGAQFADWLGLGFIPIFCVSLTLGVSAGFIIYIFNKIPTKYMSNDINIEPNQSKITVPLKENKFLKYLMLSIIFVLLQCIPVLFYYIIARVLTAVFYFNLVTAFIIPVVFAILLFIYISVFWIKKTRISYWWIIPFLGLQFFPLGYLYLLAGYFILCPKGCSW